MTIAPTDPATERRLRRLERQVRRDLDFIEAPLRPWVPERRGPDGSPISDVVVVGAGLSGLSIAFGLWRQGVERVLVIDAAEAGREGPWVTTARMRTLRSPKTLTGPDHGIPSLTYRAWHEAMFGKDDWNGLDKIDRHHWMQYLLWFRRVTGITVRNGTRLLDIDGDDRQLRLRIEEGGAISVLHSRKAVLATGIEGAGGALVPGIVAGHLPRDRWTHGSEALDLAGLANKEIAVVGAAATGFDWAVGSPRGRSGFRHADRPFGRAAADRDPRLVQLSGLSRSFRRPRRCQPLWLRPPAPCLQDAADPGNV